MQVKTNILLSVIIGEYPIIERAEDFKTWEKEYMELTKLLPFVLKKGAPLEELKELNREARTEAVLRACPELGKISDYLEIARGVLCKHYPNGRGLDKNYYDYCKNLIQIADEASGAFHYYDSESYAE